METRSAPEPPTAARRFASIPELIMHLVDYVDEDDLAAMRLVNMASCEVATKCMFYSFRVHNAEYPGMELEDLVKELLIENRILRHVRVLHVDAYCKGMIETRTGHLVAEKLLPFMPGLKAFHWGEGFIPDEVINALSQFCPALTVLDIKYQQGTRKDPELDPDIGYTIPNFSALRNLESLTLQYFNGPDLVAWCHKLIQLFKNNSATLRDLHLSTSARLTTLRNNMPQGSMPASMWKLRLRLRTLCPGDPLPYLQYSWHDTILAYLFHKYASVGGNPLRLEYLHLGLAHWRFQRQALAKFVHLHHLKEIVFGHKGADFEVGLENYAFNDCLRRLARLKSQGGHVQPVVQELADAMKMENSDCCALWAINCISCPDLRTMVAPVTTFNIQQLLTASSWVKPEWPQQLAIATNMPPIRWDEHHYNRLHLLTTGPVQLRMLNSLCAPSSTFSRLSDYSTEQNPTFDHMLEWVVNADDGIVEGLFLGIDVALLGSAVSKAQQFIGTQLAKLRNLSQLRIRFEKKLSNNNFPGAYQRKLSDTNPIVLRYGNDPAFVLSFVQYSRSIEYVKVTETAWRVLRDSAGNAVRLKKLKRHEEDAVELFRLYARVDACTKKGRP